MRIVSFFLGDPGGYVEAVHDAGGIVMHTVGSAEEARRAVASGVDVIVAQGWEAGGHVGSTVATLPLVPAVVDAVAPVPVIAAGGIGDARGVAAVLALGAQAAWLGTRFLLAQEMPIHEDYRRRLVAAAETDPQWYPNLYDVGWPDSPHRALRNSTAARVGSRGLPPRRPAARNRRRDRAPRLRRGNRPLRGSAAHDRDHRGHRSALDVGRAERRARETAAVSGGHRGRAHLPPVTPVIDVTKHQGLASLSGFPFEVRTSASTREQAGRLADRCARAYSYLGDMLAFRPQCALVVLNRADWSERASNPLVRHAVLRRWQSLPRRRALRPHRLA